MSGAVPIKPCGECVMCCEWLDIETEGLSKKAGALCPHCTGAGCGIYDTRPSLCQGFFCGWQVIPGLGNDWRPDRSGVMILMVENPPRDYGGAQMGFNFAVLGGERALRRAGVAEYVATLVSRQVAVYLSADSPRTLINDYVAPLAKAGDIAGLTDMLIHIYRLHREAKKRGLVPP